MDMFRNTKSRAALLAALTCALCIAAASPVRAKVVERIVAVVNGDAITQSDLEARAGSDTGAASRRANALERERRKRQALDGLIDEVLLRQAIEKSDIAVTDDELMRAIQNILAQNRMTSSQLRDEIARKGMTFDEYQEQVRFEIKKVKFVNQVISTELKITDRDLKDYFDEHRAGFRGGKEAHVAEIVLPLVDVTTEEEAIELRDTAISIVRQCRENASAFERLAKIHSKGPNADKGGDLGVVKLEDLPARVAATVKTLPAGMVSDPVPTENAVIIVKLIDWPAVSVEDFESVRDVIYQRLHDERLSSALDAYVQRLRHHAYIDIK